MIRRGRHGKGPRWLFFVLLALPFFGVFPYLRTVNNPNEFVRVFNTMMLVERHTFKIDEPVRIFGWVNDMARVPGEDGEVHYYSVKAPGASYLGVVPYALFAKVVAPALGKQFPGSDSSQDERLWWLKYSTWILRLFAVQLPCFLFLLWFERYLRDFAPDPVFRFVAVAAVAIGTNFFAYAQMFASHAPQAAAAFLAFGITERELRRSRGSPRERRASRAMLAGFFTSACVAFEYQALFPAAVLAVFGAVVFRRPSRLAAFALGGVPNVVGVMVFQWRAFGNPLTPGHMMLETQQFAAIHHQGLFGVTWPAWGAIKALSADPGFGFFGMSPFMVLGLVAVPLVLLSPYGTPTARRALRVATLIWALVCASILGVSAGFLEWRGGWTIGPRYLVAWAPFFGFGAATCLERLAGRGAHRRAALRGLAGGLALASVLAVGTVGLVYDTLPERVARPFAQFAIPMARAGLVPHHLGEWFGWETTTFWYVCCGAMLLIPLLFGLGVGAEPSGRLALRTGTFAAALTVGLVPAFSTPEDGSELFVLHPSVHDFPPAWQPKGRDRVTRLREDAERYGPRRPCHWHRLAELERGLGRAAQAASDEARAGVPRALCARFLF
jgi:hypothetical protein